MRRIILNAAVSLDGFIEGPNGEIDWCFTDQDYGMTDFLKRIDAVFFGRKSFELIKTMDKNPFPDKYKYVFSRKIELEENKTRVIKTNLEKEVLKIKNENGKDIWLFGGAESTSALANAGLLDEMHLAVHPIFLGRGKPLFLNLDKQTYLRLHNLKTYSSGLVQLFYKVYK